MFIVFPTLLFYLLGSDIFSERALFNFDYPALALVAFAKWPLPSCGSPCPDGHRF